MTRRLRQLQPRAARRVFFDQAENGSPEIDSAGKPQLQAQFAITERLREGKFDKKEHRISGHLSDPTGVQNVVSTSSFRRRIEILQQENASLKAKCRTIHYAHSALIAEIAEKDRVIGELQATPQANSNCDPRAVEDSVNLRGDVLIFARVRPLESNENRSDKQVKPCCEVDGQWVRLPGRKKFGFDRVFSTSAQQGEIIEEVSQFVESAIRGNRACLFAYGQTGSGKTHTMQGGVNEERGIIPRAVEMVLAERARLAHHGWAYVVKMSFLEIYNEKLYDLLFATKGKRESLEIKLDPNGGNHVPGLKQVTASDWSKVATLLERSKRNRSTAPTDMNPNSSRSHYVFTMHLHGTNATDNSVRNGRLSIVDLAGSERLEKSGAVGDRRKETQHINKSLSSLKDVFIATRKNASHVPFRNNKLTRLLQGSFTGRGKVLMILNISSAPESADETLCSLQFAEEINER